MDRAVSRALIIEEMSCLTEDEEVEALVVHILVDEHLLVGLHAAPQQAHQVGVLQLGDQLDLRLELHQTLHRHRRQPLDRDLQAAGQLTLDDIMMMMHTDTMHVYVAQKMHEYAN